METFLTIRFDRANAPSTREGLQLFLRNQAGGCNHLQPEVFYHYDYPKARSIFLINSTFTLKEKVS